MRSKLAIFALLIAILLSSCGLGAQATPIAISTNTPIPLPTLTPSPTTPLAMLILPADMEKETSDLYQKAVYDLAQQSGFRFQVRNALSATDLDPSLKIVIALPPDPGVAALAAAAPQVQFLAVNIPGVAAGGNLSTLASAGQVDVPAFLAGYVAAMITDDYHIGMILPKDDPDAQKALAAFTNGMAFYCGLCRPFYYLPYTFPQSIEIPTDEDPKRYGAYADYLILQRKVDTLYVYPDVATPDLLTYIGTTGAWTIGLATPDPRPAGWVMTIQPDVIKAIQAAWPNLVAGQGGASIPSPLGLADVDPALLTPGKQRLAEQTLNDLMAGRISTGINP